MRELKELCKGSLYTKIITAQCILHNYFCFSSNEGDKTESRTLMYMHIQEMFLFQNSLEKNSNYTVRQ